MSVHTLASQENNMSLFHWSYRLQNQKHGLSMGVVWYYESGDNNKIKLNKILLYRDQSLNLIRYGGLKYEKKI